MKKFFDLLSNLCTTFVSTFDNYTRQLFELGLQGVNVGIRILLAYALYKLFAQAWLLELLTAI